MLRELFIRLASLGRAQEPRAPSSDSEKAAARRLIDEGNRAEKEGRLREACEQYHAAVTAAPGYAAAHLNLGIGLEAMGDADGARKCYESALAIDPMDVYATYNLGKMLYGRGLLLESERLLVSVVARKPDFPEANVVLASVYDARGNLAAAAAALESALRQRPDYPGALYNQAMVLRKLGRLVDAESALRHAIRLDPDNIGARKLLGTALIEQGKLYDGEVCYRELHARDPRDIDVLNSLGYVVASQGKLSEAAAFLEKALGLEPNFPDALSNLGNVLRDQGRLDGAVACYRRAIDLNPELPEAHSNLGNILRDQGQTEQAIACYRQALSLQPEYAEARWSLAMAQIPIVYETGVEPSRCRAAFSSELAELERWFNAARIAKGSSAVGAQQPFYLAYQEENNRALLQRYGSLCSRLMNAWFDEQHFTDPSPSRHNDFVRVGVVSQHFCNHSVWNALIKGWFRQLDPARFALHSFYLGFREDQETLFARTRSSHFEQGGRGLRQWVETILGSRLDVLIYPEIGMDPVTVKLASLRLAPVQIATWGHPETTGLPTIDYYLSAENMEPLNAQENYTERLISLPHIGCFYEPSRIDPVPPDLAGEGIEPGLPVLLCPGVPFKYAPQHDWILADIARRLGRCRFIFFTHHIPEMSAKFRRRLEVAFTRSRLDIDRFATFLGWQSPPAFHGWLRRADVFLDTIGFSGFNTAMQAVECGLPIVAREGRFLRGRLASGLLKRMGMRELIAETEEEYIALAVRLCQDVEYRRGIRERIEANRHLLYEDTAPTRALEDILAKATARGR